MCVYNYTQRSFPKIEVYLESPTSQTLGQEGFFHALRSRKTLCSVQYSPSECCRNHNVVFLPDIYTCASCVTSYCSILQRWINVFTTVDLILKSCP